MSEKEDTLPVYSPIDGPHNGGASLWATRRAARRHRPWPIFVLTLLTFIVLGAHIHLTRPASPQAVRVPLHATEIQARCENLKLKPGPPPNFRQRTQSDRYVEGTRPTFIKNATIWTGRVNGYETLRGDIFLKHGLIKAIGHVPPVLLGEYGEYDIVDAKGAWVSPG